jgi:hypothetical protein
LEPPHEDNPVKTVANKHNFVALFIRRSPS